MPELGTQTQIIWKEQFVSGVESPLLGLFVTLTLFLLIKQGLRKKKSNDK